LHVLVLVEDHSEACEPLARWLQRHNFEVSSAADPHQLLQRLSRQPVDAVVLDVTLAHSDGLQLCQDISRNRRTPVILLSACAGPAQRIAGLEAGADDYLLKPVDPAELAARIRTVHRRHTRTSPGAGPTTLQVTRRVGFEGWLFDTQCGDLKDPGGQAVALSDTEQHLLCALVAHPDIVLTRDRLLALMHGHDRDVFDRAVDTQISRLRRKLEIDPRRPRLIKTERSSGYRFVAAVHAIAL